MDEAEYTIIPKSEYPPFSEKMASKGFTSLQGLHYTDGTVKVWIKPTKREPETPITWEQERRRYLREGHTNPGVAGEGYSLGILSSADQELWESFYLFEEAEYLNPPIEEIDFLRINPPSIKETLEEKLVQVIRKAERDYLNRDAEENLASNNRSSMSHRLLRRLESKGFYYAGYLKEEDKIDIIGHAFGLFNNGCVEFEKTNKGKVSSRVKLNPQKTIDYIEEHLVRNLMSPEVAFNYLRRIRNIKPRKGYMTYSYAQKFDFVMSLIDKYKSDFIIKQEKERRAKLRLEVKARDLCPEIFNVFGNCQVIKISRRS